MLTKYLALSLLHNAPHDLARARLLAVSAALLNALPSSSLGLRMDDGTIRVVVGDQFFVVLTPANTVRLKCIFMT